jgi:hypothetical protein
VGLTTLPCKKKIVEKPPRNSAGFCGGGQGLDWAVEPRKEEEEEEEEEENSPNRIRCQINVRRLQRDRELCFMLYINFFVRWAAYFKEDLN